ncbi:MAG: response regulator, partial [Gemmatimonadetes bacterium]|nr:response regulator [Gemmatimonadota bacterium]NIR78004.1 response regulator [Gemmatimonadota bacterium]NIT86539.1 response regulator [Gemmatimonadota bacterium]NIU30401.1 response regulator [Gemmatimonadota bacterium]NIU35276.1 response regulator [Gemmatimonadota bacterium]
QNILTMYGWRVSAAGDAREALSVARGSTESFDLMILDIVLPGGMSGLTLADILYRIHPRSAFLFISGEVDFEVPLSAIPRARKDFVCKPMSMMALVEKARGLLRGSGSGAASPGAGSVS